MVTNKFGPFKVRVLRKNTDTIQAFVHKNMISDSKSYLGQAPLRVLRKNTDTIQAFIHKNMISDSKSYLGQAPLSPLFPQSMK